MPERPARWAIIHARPPTSPLPNPQRSLAPVGLPEQADAELTVSLTDTLRASIYIPYRTRMC